MTYYIVMSTVCFIVGLVRTLNAGEAIASKDGTRTVVSGALAFFWFALSFTGFALFIDTTN
jgi:hypothetical protein